MKRILLHIFIILSVTSCSTDDNNPVENGSSKEEIRLYVDIGATTKAPVDSTFSTDFSIGVYAKDSLWKAGQNANWINCDSATVAGEAGHPMIFSDGPYFYPINGSILNFYTFAPYASETTSAMSGVGPLVTHYITGQEDVMWATATGQKPVSGPVNVSIFNFIHKLTQLQFTFKADVTYVLTNKVISLKIKAQPTDVVMDVETGACSFSGSSDMEAISAADQVAGIPITAAGQDALSPVMTKAETGTTAYTLDIVVKTASGNITYTNIPVNVDAIEGHNYMIILTFRSTADFPIGISLPVVQS